MFSLFTGSGGLQSVVGHRAWWARKTLGTGFLEFNFPCRLSGGLFRHSIEA